MISSHPYARPTPPMVQPRTSDEPGHPMHGTRAGMALAQSANPVTHMDHGFGVPTGAVRAPVKAGHDLAPLQGRPATIRLSRVQAEQLLRSGRCEISDVAILSLGAEAVQVTMVPPTPVGLPSPRSAAAELVSRLRDRLSEDGAPVQTGMARDGGLAPQRTYSGRGSALLNWRLKRVVAYVEANLAERIQLHDLAGAAGISRMHFALQFRNAVGCRPHDYVLLRRIERSQLLLGAHKTPLVEIALSVGFQTQAHFTTVFKRIVGITPGQWRMRGCREPN